MVRVATIMHVFPDKHEEYKLRHDHLFPEMRDVLKKYGVSNYSIFLNRETSELYAYLEVEDYEVYNQIARTPECKKWWAYMKDIMETNEDNSPVSIKLEEVFYLS